MLRKIFGNTDRIKILKELCWKEKLTINELSRMTNLDKSIISNNLTQLSNIGVIEQCDNFYFLNECEINLLISLLSYSIYNVGEKFV